MTLASSHIPVNIEDEMRRSYMDYAMSVIIGRALPDVRDGLKPAHRRVLYGMRLMGLGPTRPYRKCAKIVGEVMGNFHPHGDASIYDTLVRLAQGFNMRNLLVDGQGNFGSVDGDPPAAMRYTEARLQPLADEVMADLDKETVDFVPNYDESTEEPTVLPAPFPNLLVNGSSGIAVGMATNIPPHNLREIIDGVVWVIEHGAEMREAKAQALLRIILGPDFPTGGFIVGRDGIRSAYRIERGEVPEVVLNNLYKHTSLQTSFGVIMLAIVGGRPRVLSLLELVEHFIAFRRDVVQRRTEFELKKAEARAHLLEGLTIALDQLDAVIKLIRGSKTPAEARAGLMAQFQFTQIQAQAILDMQLQRLTSLERQKLADELAELRQTIERLRAILANETLLMQIVVQELRAVQDKYGDERRTQLIEETGAFRIEDLIAEEDMAITVSNTGYIKRTAISSYRNQRRGGKGRIGMRTREEDFITHLFVASTHAYILIFSDRGRVYWLKVHEIPDVGPGGKGKAIANLVSMRPDEKIAALLAVREWPETEGEHCIVMGTRKGAIKKTDLTAYEHPRTGGIMAMGVDESDAVIAAEMTDGRGEVFLGTRLGMAIRFLETDVRSMGRTAHGVRGISLRNGDEVVAMAVVEPGGTLLTVTESGYGKRTELDEYRVQSRGGVGIINIQTTERNGRVVGITHVRDEHQLMLITQQGKILRMVTGDIRSIGRATQGVRLIEIEEGDRVVSVARLAEREEREAGDKETEQE